LKYQIIEISPRHRDAAAVFRAPRFNHAIEFPVLFLQEYQFEAKIRLATYYNFGIPALPISRRACSYPSRVLDIWIIIEWSAIKVSQKMLELFAWSQILGGQFGRLAIKY